MLNQNWSLSSFLKRILVASLLAFFLSVEISPGADPSFGNWKWPYALAKINAVSEIVGSTCRIWVEVYGSNSVRVWKRCGVLTTSSGVTFTSIDFAGWSGVSTGTGSDGTALPSGGSGCTWGQTGITVQACGVTPDGGGGGYVTGFNIVPRPTPSGFVWADGTSPGQELYTIKNSSCVGQGLSGSRGPGAFDTAPPIRFHFGLSGSGTVPPKYRSTVVGSVAGVCKTADSLVIDFGVVAPDCNNKWLISGRTSSRAILSGSCDCIPLHHGIEAVTPGPICSFIPISGDPAGFGAGAPGGVGTTQTGTGHIFTNADLDLLGGSIPVAGSSGTGGMSEGLGFGGAGGGVSPVAGGPGTGGGSGTGGGGCPIDDPNCGDDGESEGGSLPGIPNYNSTYGEGDLPIVKNWIQTIRDFLSGSPIVSAISGSGLTASGSCALSASVYGSNVDLGFCSVPGELWVMMSGFTLLIAHLVGAFIIFR